MQIEQTDLLILKYIHDENSDEYIEHNFEVYKIINLKNILEKMNNILKKRQISFRIFKLKELNILKIKRPDANNSDMLAIYFTSEGDEILQSIS